MSKSGENTLGQRRPVSEDGHNLRCPNRFYCFISLAKASVMGVTHGGESESVAESRTDGSESICFSVNKIRAVRLSPYSTARGLKLLEQLLETSVSSRYQHIRHAIGLHSALFTTLSGFADDDLRGIIPAVNGPTVLVLLKYDS